MTQNTHLPRFSFVNHRTVPAALLGAVAVLAGACGDANRSSSGAEEQSFRKKTSSQTTSSAASNGEANTAAPEQRFDFTCEARTAGFSCSPALPAQLPDGSRVKVTVHTSNLTLPQLNLVGNNLKITGSPGAEYVIVTGDNPLVNLSSGDDWFVLVGNLRHEDPATTSIKTFVTMGSGNDVVYHVGDMLRAGINLGAGNDAYLGTGNYEYAQVNGQDGEDTIVGRSPAEGARVSHSSTFSGGNDRDSLGFFGTGRSSFVLKGEAGDDHLENQEPHLASNLTKLDGGEGNDGCLLIVAGKAQGPRNSAAGCDFDDVPYFDWNY